MAAQGIKYSSFSPLTTLTGAQECFITAVSPEGLSLQESLDELAAWYRSALLENNLDRSTQQFTRIFISDIANEQELLLESDLFDLIASGAVSVVQQSPLNGGSVGMFSYHIASKSGSFRQKDTSGRADVRNRSVCTSGSNYSLLWSSNFSSNSVFDSEKQTRDVFSSLSSSLQSHGMTIARNVIRTWIFVRDIDNHYGGMVKARRELFERIGLTSKTRYIASTGIEGKGAEPSALVSLDAFSIGNIREEQIVRMEAPEHLSSTILYGVTFERGTRIRFGDRSHLHISGTASINKFGKTLYPMDIRRQAIRTIDNVEALLEPHGATLHNMQYMIVYLRNPKHFPLIQDLLGERIPESVPVVAVEAPVCRPGWLFEVDGMGIIPDTTDFLPFT